MNTKKKPGGLPASPANPIWLKSSGYHRGRRPQALFALKAWEKRNPEEARMVRERFEVTCGANKIIEQSIKGEQKV